MSEHPPGWHPDPRGRHEYRYWDGTAWTDHVGDRGQASLDPVADVTPAGESKRPAAGEPAGEPAGAVEPATWRTPELQAERAESRPEEPSESAPAAGGGLWAGRVAEGAATEPRPGATDPDLDPGPEPAAEQRPASDPAAAGTPPGYGPEPAAGATPGPEPAVGATEPAVATDRSPALAGLLTVVAPGAGHFYLGPGSKAALAGGLLGATAAAYVIAWFSFASFIVACVLWAATAAYGLYDLQGVLAPVRRAGAAAAAISRRQVGLVLLVGGVVLVVSLVLPWYHVSYQIEGLDNVPNFGGSGSGFEVLSVIDIVLLVIGVGAAVLGTTALGIGPLSGPRLPPWLPAATAAAGGAAVVLVAYRLFFDGAPSTASTSGAFGSPQASIAVGRGPGILLAGAASLAIAVAGLLAVAQGPPRTSSVNRGDATFTE